MNSEIRIKRPIIPFNPPVYICKRATKPLVLDGKLDKDFWQDAPFTDYFIDIQGDSLPTPRFKTRAKMLWDDENMYFGAILEGDEIWATITERDEVIFRDNDFEIFIDPDSDTQQYYEFEMNAYNTIWDLFLTKAYRDLGQPLNSWDIKGIRSCVYIDGDINNPNATNRYWSVEVVMPFTSLIECAPKKSVPTEGDYWRINFSRVHWQVDTLNNQYKKQINPDTNAPYPEDNWVWAPTGVINMHYPELWGFVFFTYENELPNYTIPEEEYIKYQLRTVYYAEHAYFDEFGYFTADINLLHEVSLPETALTIQATNHSFEASCLNTAGTKEFVIFADGKVSEIQLSQ